jgi:CRISPR type III-A-associated RAMP protein Csm4
MLTSAFPFIETNGQIVYFFPKLYSEPLKPQDNIDRYKLAKKFNNVRYVDDKLFQEILDNGYNNQALWDKLLGGDLYLSLDNKVLSKNEILSFPLKLNAVPRNAIDRIKSGTIEGKLYHTTEVFFKKGSGAFLLAKISEEWFKKIIAVFRYYSDKGLGGDTSVGKGNYLLEVKEGFPFQEVVNGNQWITLSLYSPKEDEWQYYRNNSKNVWYSVIKRKGKIESGFSPSTNIWKKSVLMFEEGSTFPVIEGKTIYGALPEVKSMSNMNILQYGFGFSVKMR